MDSSEKDLEFIRKTLEHERFEVMESLTAEDALDLLEREEVNLAICSVHMSGMSGTEFLNELHSWDLDVPVILIGEYGKEKEWLDALHTEASTFVSKPLRRETLLKAVHKAFQEKKELLNY